MEEKTFEWDDESKSWLRGLLKDTVVTVWFNKQDGTERIMKCTLNEQNIPSDKNSERSNNPNVQVVWDIEKKEWRSFRWNSLKQIFFTLE